MGVLDFAGGTVVHMSAGWAALAGAILLGRRKSHVNNETHSPANVPFVLLGTGMLWFGWFGFNAGSALAADGKATLAFATTNTASAAAMLGWIFFDWLKGQQASSALGVPASARWPAWSRSHASRRIRHGPREHHLSASQRA